MLHNRLFILQSKTNNKTDSTSVSSESSAGVVIKQKHAGFDKRKGTLSHVQVSHMHSTC